jgi:hypothetical protein
VICPFLFSFKVLWPVFEKHGILAAIGSHMFVNGCAASFHLSIWVLKRLFKGLRIGILSGIQALKEEASL